MTLWRRLRSGATPTLEAVGGAVRAIHEATAVSLPGSVPDIDPFGQVRACLDWPSPWSGSTAVKELRRRADELASRWREGTQDDPLGRVVVHGDPHVDNAMVSDGGGLVLLDLEDAGVGPASWDFPPLAVGVERYGFPAGDYNRFAAGYGPEPGAWPGHSLMSHVYEPGGHFLGGPVQCRFAEHGEGGPRCVFPACSRAIPLAGLCCDRYQPRSRSFPHITVCRLERPTSTTPHKMCGYVRCLYRGLHRTPLDGDRR